MKRTIVVFIALVSLLASASTATAGEALSTEKPTPDTPSTVVEVVPPATTTETPATTTETPATTTEVPATTTEVPVTTEAPATTTEVPTTTVDGLGTDIDTGCTMDCIPETEMLGCDGASCIPDAVAGVGGVPTAVGTGRALPFTGIEDAIAPLLLALTVVLGGVVAWRWAQLRESVAEAAARRNDAPIVEQTASGYSGAARQLQIEQRARRVFTARVA